MEEAKAAAYYDELTRKGSGAARFKQGLGFSDSTPSKSPRNPSSSSSSSFYANFVRSSNPAGSVPEDQKKAQLENIQSKLRKNSRPPSPSPVDPDRDNGSELDDHHSGRDRDSRGGSRHRHRSRSRERDRGGEDKGRSRRRRSRSRSWSDEDRGRSHRSSRGGDREYSCRRSRSPKARSRIERGSRREEEDVVRRSDSYRNKNSGTDYSRVIEGYSDMTPAEKVKAKMRHQLSQTAKKDMAKGVNTGWERFDFNKEAPLDEEEETEVADDDASLVKDMGRSFRFSAVDAKREDQIKAAHDQAMFGAPTALPVLPEESTDQSAIRKDNEDLTNTTLISDEVFAMQQGSWRDRVRRPQD